MRWALLIGIYLVLFAREAHAQSVWERAQQYEPLLLAAATRHQVDARLLWTICYLETKFQPRLTSPKGAQGMTQLMPATARRFGVTNSFDPQQSIEATARYLRLLLSQFDGDIRLALAAYNAGETAVLAYRDGRSITLPNGKVINPNKLKTDGVPTFRETQGYVRQGQQVLQWLTQQPAATQSVTMKPQDAPQQPRKMLPGQSVYLAAEGQVTASPIKATTNTNENKAPQTKSVYFTAQEPRNP